MNENIRTEGQLISAVLLIGLSVILIPLSLGMLLSYPDEIWYLGIVMSIANGLILYGGIAALVKSKKMTKAKSEAVASMTRAAQASEPSPLVSAETATEVSNEKIFANWTFDPIYWKKFQKTEGKIRLGNSLLLLVLITAGGGWILHDDEGEGWTFSLLFSGGFGLLILVIQFLLSRSNFAIGDRKRVTVIIDSNKVLINDKLYYFNNSERWIADVKMTSRDNLDMVEFSYQWRTRAGTTSDELLIPVPPGKEGEARLMVSEIRSIHGLKDASETDPRYKWQGKS